MTGVKICKFERVADLVEELGGATKVSKELGLNGPSTVSEMKRRNSIPVQLWPSFIELAIDLCIEGVDSEMLMKVHLPSQKKNRRLASRKVIKGR